MRDKPKEKEIKIETKPFNDERFDVDDLLNKKLNDLEQKILVQDPMIPEKEKREIYI